MAVNFNPNLSSVFANDGINKASAPKPADNKASFGQAMAKGINGVNEMHNQADASITDLLSGKSSDVNSVVSDVAKADMSFKLLVGVRNKLVEAYKETMRMPI